MKAVILAGGRGTRLTEETTLKPKPLVEANGKPLIWHIMQNYSRHGITDFIILSGYKGQQIREYFANFWLHQADLTFDLSTPNQEIHKVRGLPWKVTVLDTSLGSAIAPGPGTITLTENFSSSWQALFNGVPLERSSNEFGLPQFKVLEAGEIDFLHDGTGRRAWISIFLIVLVTSIVMALPSGRRRREMLDREVS